MRKLALLLAAGLLVGAPLTAAVTTDTYAAAKKAKKAGKAPASKEVSPDEANARFGRALGDLANSLGTYIYVPGDVGGGDKGGKKGKKAGGKKTAKKGGGSGGGSY